MDVDGIGAVTAYRKYTWKDRLRDALPGRKQSADDTLDATILKTALPSVKEQKRYFVCFRLIPVLSDKQYPNYFSRR